ncbi:MAG TPA: DUF5655 domain-containing protein [Phycisphaerales bacterium]|nr:DUF5655 domain-containing protein [Phycisphaerales bacterium]
MTRAAKPKPSASKSTSPKPGKHPEYGVHPGVAMMIDWVKTLKEKTGRSLPEWIKHINADGPATEEARRDWLKKKYNLGTNTAWWLAERSLGKGGDEDTPGAYLSAAKRYVDTMYAGNKSNLRPLHDALIKLGYSIAKDVKACPCQTIVPLYRNHVIAQIKPATQTRIDLGLALGPLIKEGKTKFPPRLIDTGGFKKKDRITHRFVIERAEDIDDEVKSWLKKVYDADAKD